MSTLARKRLMRDFKWLQQDTLAGISGAPHDNILLWNAVIFRPDYTLWDGVHWHSVVCHGRLRLVDGLPCRVSLTHSSSVDVNEAVGAKRC